MKYSFKVVLHFIYSYTLYLCHSCMFHHVLCVCVLVCTWLPGVVVTSRVLSSLLPGECVWGESCPWLSWTQMCWTACTHWAVSETESSSHAICNVKSKLFFPTLNVSRCVSEWVYDKKTAIYWMLFVLFVWCHTQVFIHLLLHNLHLWSSKNIKASLTQCQ